MVDFWTLNQPCNPRINLSGHDVLTDRLKKMWKKYNTLTLIKRKQY